MIDLAPLTTFLRIVSVLGLIVTVCMMTAVIYKKIQTYYPDKAEKSKYIFVIVAVLMSGVLTFLFLEFMGNKDSSGVLTR